MDNVHRTRLRVMLLVMVVAMLSLAAIAQAQAPAPYSVEAGMAAGGSYRLATLTWQACGTISGDGYRLSTTAAAIGFESGCCCTFLPITIGP
jgi:hypothetical protein